MLTLRPIIMRKIQEISIIGTGLVGQTLAKYFLSRGLKIRQIVFRTPPKQKLPQVSYIEDLKALDRVDLVLICVNDASLQQVIESITDKQFVAYTSGAIGLDQFEKRENLAVFYPLQSFAHLNESAIAQIPILLESKNAETMEILKDFASSYFSRFEEMNSEKRFQLHLAAVFANNFTNHLIHLAQKHCEKNNLPFDLLLPLIIETAEKWKAVPARELQTGPAIRGDENVVEKHLTHLTKNFQDIYRILSQSIMNEKDKT